MERRTLPGALIALVMVVLLAACGGKASVSGSGPVTATVKIATTGNLPSGSLIGSAEATLKLPDGVSVKATADSENPLVLVTDPGVVTATGVAGGNASNLVLATYATTSSSTAAFIKIANPAGFGIGEFATVKCDIASGHSPSVPNFTVTGFRAVDLDGSTIKGLSAVVTVVMQ